MSRILFIVGNMNYGGAETFIMKNYRIINREKVQFDFLTVTENNTYGNEIRQLGGTIYVGFRRQKHFLKMFLFVLKTVKKNKYDTVYFSTNCASVILDLIAAKLGGANRLIVRSSSSKSSNLLMNILNITLRPFVNLLADFKLAPSVESGRWLFGKGANVRILNNGLDLVRYRYDIGLRNTTRHGLGLDGKFVVCHVGRFVKVKNHILLLNAFAKLYTYKPNAVLMLVGSGPELDSSKALAVDLGISDKVMFMGERNDVSALLTASDVFVLPSIYEGMPNALIEAQATGLPCVVSDKVTSTAKIIPPVTFLSIKEHPSFWAEHILACAAIKFNREEGYKYLLDAGYDISCTTAVFEEYFLKEVQI